MSTYVSVAGLQPHQIWGGVVARPLHGERLTVGILDFEPLTHVPEHRHAGEQLGLVVKGSITMVIDGESRDLHMGDMCDPIGTTHHVLPSLRGAGRDAWANAHSPAMGLMRD